MQNEKLYPYRWAILIALAAVLFCLQFACIITPGIATTIMPEYNMSPAAFGILCNMPFLAGVLFGIPSGTLGDRIGIKKVITLGMIICIIGAFWRAMSTSFIMLCISSVVMGIAVAALNANSTKVIRLWFPGRAMGSAMGVYVCGASLGAGVALKAGPIFASTSSAYMSCGWLSIVCLAIWLLLFRSHPDGETAVKEESPLKHMGDVLKNKNVWLVSLFVFFVFAASTSAQTYMNAGLSEYCAGNIGIASTIASTSAVFVAIGSIGMPMVIARFKRLKPVLSLCCIFCAASLVLVFILPAGIPTVVLFFFFGIFMGAMLAMGKAVPALLPNIDPKNLGAVGGLQSTLQNIGAWAVAGYILAPVAQAVIPGNLYLGIYAGCGVCCVLAAVCIILLPEMPTSMDAKLKLDAQAKK